MTTESIEDNCTIASLTPDRLTPDRFNPSNVKSISTPYGTGKMGTLQDGTKVIVRPGSSGLNSKPTLEFQRADGRKLEEYRY